MFLFTLDHYSGESSFSGIMSLHVISVCFQFSRFSRQLSSLKSVLYVLNVVSVIILYPRRRFNYTIYTF